MIAETNAAYLKRLRQEAVAKGLCYVCRCRPVTAGTRYCEPCMSASHARRRAKEEKRRRKGRCPECGQKPLPGLVLCLKHHARGIALNTKKRQRRIERGQCPRCAGVPIEGKQLCVRCYLLASETIERRTDRLRQEGRCTVCGRKKHCEQVWCQACRDRHKLRKIECLDRKDARAA